MQVSVATKSVSVSLLQLSVKRDKEQFESIEYAVYFY